MIGGCAELIGFATIACPVLTPDEILDMHLPRVLQLKSLGMIRQNVPLKPAGGGNLRREAEQILGEFLAEWMGE